MSSGDDARRGSGGGEGMNRGEAGVSPSGPIWEGEPWSPASLSAVFWDLRVTLGVVEMVVECVNKVCVCVFGRPWVLPRSKVDRDGEKWISRAA